MTDIVKRLRQCDENFELVQEAADEIERLRAENDKCARLIAGSVLDRQKAVAAEREAILELIESERADYANMYLGDYALQTIAAAIRARGA
jgi:hypothetical protein